MLTVALIGPDGSGKSTLAAALVERLPVPAVTLYMGVNPHESDVRSPLARLATLARRGRGPRHDAGPPPRPDAPEPRSAEEQSLRRRIRRELRSVARALNLVVDEVYRQRVIARHRRDGRLVVLDRDFWADYRMHDVEADSRSLGRRLHGAYLERWYRKPDLHVYLEAPAEVLFARKGEGTVELLRARQDDYLALAPSAPQFVRLDVDRPLDEVVTDLVDLAMRSNPARSGDVRGTVLVTDAARGSAVAVIRSLGAAGWRVVAADPSRLAPGRYSRHTSVRATYPDPLTDPRRAAEAVLGLAAQHGVDLIIPVTDDIGTPLDAVRDAVPAHVRIASPPPDVRRIATDKAATVELAGRLGVPLPDTVVVRPGGDPDLPAVAAQLGWPVVVKPAESRLLTAAGLSKQEVTVARDLGTLRDALVSRAGGTVLLQAMVRGEGHGIELVCDHGRPLAAFQHRRVREVPLSGGPSSSRESVELDPILYRHSAALLAAVEWTGLAMVEWKVGPDGPALMEINGRIWGSLPLAVAAGVDFPRLLADVVAPDGSVAGAVPSPVPDTVPTYEVGVRTRSLELELRWIGAALRSSAGTGTGPSRRDALRVAAGLFDPREGYDVQSRRDPLPGVVDLVRLARKSIGR